MTHLLHRKDQLFGILIAFLAYVENYFHQSINFVRSNNGTEIVHSSCAQMFSSKGIIHQKSVHGNPQQNGRVERKHWHLLDTARALRFHVNLPIKF